MCNLTLFWLLTWILILLGWFFWQYKLSEFVCICISLSCRHLCLCERWQTLQDKLFHVSVCAAALLCRFTAFIKSVPFCKVWMFPSLVMFTLYLTVCQIIFGPPSKTCFDYQDGIFFNVRVQELESSFYNTVQRTAARRGFSKLNLRDPEFAKMWGGLLVRDSKCTPLNNLLKKFI